MATAIFYGLYLIAVSKYGSIKGIKFNKMVISFCVAYDVSFILALQNLISINIK